MPAREQGLHGPTPVQQPAGALDPTFRAGGIVAWEHPDTARGFELRPFLEGDFGAGRPLIDPVLESPAMPIAPRLIEVATPVAGGRGTLDAVLAPIQQRTVCDPRWFEAIVRGWRHWLRVFARVVMADFKHRDSGSN